jgi:hypothetical protein
LLLRFTDLRSYGVTELRSYGITELRNYGVTCAFAAAAAAGLRLQLQLQLFRKSKSGGIEKLFTDKLTPAAYLKVKALKDSKFLDFNNLQILLFKNNELSISNEKWYRIF